MSLSVFAPGTFFHFSPMEVARVFTQCYFTITVFMENHLTPKYKRILLLTKWMPLAFYLDGSTFKMCSPSGALTFPMSDVVPITLKCACDLKGTQN